MSQIYEEDKINELIIFAEGYKAKRCLDCGAITIDGEHSGDHTITTEVRIPWGQWIIFKNQFLLTKLPSREAKQSSEAKL